MFWTTPKIRCAARAATSAIAFAAAALPAGADVTPTQVWQALSDYFERFGYAVSSGVAPVEGDVLRIDDAVLDLALPEAAGTVRIAFGDLRLSSLGDGTVEVALAETMPIRIETRPPGEDPVELRLDYRLGTPALTASGDPGDMSFDFSAERLDLVLSGMRVAGAAVPGEDAAFDLFLEAVAATTRVTEGGGLRVAQTLRADAFGYAADFLDPPAAAGTAPQGGAAPQRVRLSGSYSDVEVASDTRLPRGAESGTDLGALLGMGLTGSGSLSWRDGAARFTGESAGQESAVRTASQRGTLRVDMSPDRLGYALSAEGLAYAISGSDMPFPVTAEMGRAALDIALPVAAADTPQDFSLGLALSDLTVAEAVWRMFDPEGRLPRDPATLTVDLSGAATPFVDLLDPAAMARVEAQGAVPGEINALRIEDMRLSALGADLSGEGAFTFDPSDTATFDGMPAPEGELRLFLDGANALIDTLVEMGVVASGDAMGARMMMSMFTVPGAGPDSLRATIEVTPDGHVLANGQRIR